MEEGLVARTARKKLGVGANERERRKKERRKERKKEERVGCVCSRGGVYIGAGVLERERVHQWREVGSGGTRKRKREKEREREREREEGRGGRSLNIKVSTERASHV